MTQLDPSNTTAGDIVTAALKLANVVGTGQTANAEDNNDAWAMLQWMLQEWERKRWLVFVLSTYAKVSTGAQSYTVGPGGDIDTGAQSVRPDKLESAYLRQLVNSQPNQIDYPLEILGAREDYNKIALKSLSSFPSTIYYEASWPLGRIYPWPVPQATIYGLNCTFKAQLPYKFANLATKFTSIPFEYYNAMIFNLALRLRAMYGIQSYAGDTLPGLAKDSLNTLRGANTQISRLSIPRLDGSGQYNIFSDRTY